MARYFQILAFLFLSSTAQAQSPFIFGPSDTAKNLQSNAILKRLKLLETGGGTDDITIQPPAALAAPYTLTLPADDGGSGQFLQSNGSGVLTWADTGATIGGTVSGGTAGSVLFVGTGPVLAQDNAAFFWDDTNNRLGIGTATPANTLDIVASAIDVYGQIASTATNLDAAMHFFDGTHLVGIGLFGASGGGTTGSLVLYSGAPRLVVANGGNVGVGTVAPNHKFDVRDAGMDTYAGIVSDATSRDAALNFADGSHSGAYIGMFGGSGGGTTGDLSLYNNGVRFSVSTAGAVTIFGSGGAGGNVPFAIDDPTDSETASSDVCSVTCGAGKRLSSGGCMNSSGVVALIGSWPSSSTTWSCKYNSAVGDCDAWAICEKY